MSNNYYVICNRDNTEFYDEDQNSGGYTFLNTHPFRVFGSLQMAMTKFSYNENFCMENRLRIKKLSFEEVDVDTIEVVREAKARNILDDMTPAEIEALKRVLNQG